MGIVHVYTINNVWSATVRLPVGRVRVLYVHVPAGSTPAGSVPAAPEAMELWQPHCSQPITSSMLHLPLKSRAG